MEKICNEREYQSVLEKLETVFDAKPNTDEGKELLKLIELVEEWESKWYPI